MKKTYINPKMTVTNVTLQQMIASSQQVNVGGSYNGSQRLNPKVAKKKIMMIFGNITK